MEHVDEQDKPILYLVFEYLDTDLKKYMDTVIPRNERMPLSTVKVGELNALLVYAQFEDMLGKEDMR